MKLSRIDHIALNGGDGEHYKYTEVSSKIIDKIYELIDTTVYSEIEKEVVKILVEAFPNDN